YPAMSGTYATPGSVAPLNNQPSGRLQPATGSGTGTGSSGATPSRGAAGSQLNNIDEQVRSQEPKGGNSVPDYRDAGESPRNLGTPDEGADEEDSIPRKSSSRESSSRLNEEDNENDERLSSQDERQFVKPAFYRQSAGDDEADAPRA